MLLALRYSTSRSGKSKNHAVRLELLDGHLEHFVEILEAFGQGVLAQRPRMLLHADLAGVDDCSIIENL